MKAVRALTLGISLAVGGGMAAAAFLPALAVAAEAAPSIGPKVGKPMKAAQDAMKAKNWAEALAKVKEAQAIEGKSPFEEYQINEFLGFILINQKDYAGAAAAFEKNISSGQVPAAELNNKLKTVAQLTFQTKQYPKAIDYTSRYLKVVPGEADMQMLLAQAHYLQKNYKGASEAAMPAIVVTERAGKKPDENWLLLLMRSNYELKDDSGIQTSLEKLVRHYPKPDYWDGLLSTMAKTGERNDPLTLGIYRLRLETGTLKRADDYIEMGQLAIDAGVPGEAQQVVEAGFANKLLDVPESKARNERLLASAKKLAEADKATIASEAKAAQTAPTGQADVGVGQAFLSYGEYDQAIEALERGIKKGSVRLPEEAQISLGIAYLKKGQKAQAQTAFKAVKGDTPWSRLAGLWVLRAT